MALNTSVSMVVSLAFSVLLFSVLQLYKPWFHASQMNIMLGGYLGSWIFIFLLTAISNLESTIFGEGFQAKFIPEISFSLVIACLACGIVHRVCATTCILFSMVGLYFVNKISQNCHNSALQAEVLQIKKRKK